MSNNQPCGGREYCGSFPFCPCGGPEPLPERDPTKPATEQGVFRKFDVRRTDGSDGPGGKHEGCEYFVLDVDHDQHARAALAAYATACEATHPQLAADLRSRYGLHTRPTEDVAPQRLLDLADRIDHDKLCLRAGLERDGWAQEQRDRCDAGVHLRRYADLIGSNSWRIYPPKGIPTRFSAATLDAAVAMAKREETRR